MNLFAINSHPSALGKLHVEAANQMFAAESTFSCHIPKVFAVTIPDDLNANYISPLKWSPCITLSAQKTGDHGYFAYQGSHFIKLSQIVTI